VSVAVHQLRAEQRAFWRNASAAVFTFLLPLLILGTVALVARGEADGGKHYAALFVPRMLGFALMTTMFAGPAISLTIRRERGQLKRVRGTPLPAAVYLGSFLASELLVLAVQSAAIVGFGAALGVTPAHGALIVALLLGGAVCIAPLGLVATRFVKSAEASSAVVNAIYLPLTLLSGAFFSLSVLPAPLRDVARALPLEPVVRNLGAAYPTKDAPSRNLAELLVTLAWGVAGVAIARRAFRWEPRGG
jgi:ABC-2 type transport system permease protein